MKTNKKLTLKFAVSTILATSALSISSVSAETIIHNTKANGAPAFMSGELGHASAKSSKDALKSILSAQESYGYTGNEDFEVARQWKDSLGKTHIRFKQTLNGLKVYGTSMTLHMNTTSNALSASSSSGNVYAVSGALGVDQNRAMSNSIRSNNDRGAMATQMAKLQGNVQQKPELAYVYVPQTGKLALAWKTRVIYDDADGYFQDDIIFLDANTHQIVARHPQVHNAKIHTTYDMNNQPYNSSSRPGTLVCSTGESCSDPSAQRAHDGASIVYDYFQEIHGRDGINDNGMEMISSVHTGSNWNNAVWYQNQMMYGDGDGVDFTDLTTDFDIIAHEFTHGVTDFSADLVYQNESGALNEAWSDIFGVSAEAYKNGTSSPSWKLGDLAYTPGTDGDALRYMDDPTEDDQSYDYYPERYTGTQDNGGVHLNSGIANLAYVLLVDGGTHPRNKTTEQVPSIGLAKAEKIFYRALTVYMNENTNFSGARTATAQAAEDLYGDTEKSAVESAWCAVGVGSCPSDNNGGGGDTGSSVLENGVTKSNLSASTGDDITFTMEVPSGATDISFEMSGGSGDADLYVRYGAAPTDSNYDCRPYRSGNSETCSGDSSGGTYYVRIKAYSTFSGVSLTASYTEPSTGGGGDEIEAIDISVDDVSVSRRAWQRYTYDLPAGYSDMTISISGGSGDADLYVRFGSEATTSSYDCRPYRNGNNESCTFSNPQEGTWHIDIRGYSAASGITLRLVANP